MTILEIQNSFSVLVKKMKKGDTDQQKAAEYLGKALVELNKAVNQIRGEGIELEPYPFE